MAIVLTPLQELLFSMMLDDLILALINEIAGMGEEEVNAKIAIEKVRKQAQIDQIKQR